MHSLPPHHDVPSGAPLLVHTHPMEHMLLSLEHTPLPMENTPLPMACGMSPFGGEAGLPWEVTAAAGNHSPCGEGRALMGMQRLNRSGMRKDQVVEGCGVAGWAGSFSQCHGEGGSWVSSATFEGTHR